MHPIQATCKAFAAILYDGLVVTWCDPDCGGDSSAVRDQLTDMRFIQSTYAAFAAVLSDGYVLACAGDSHTVQDQLVNVQGIAASLSANAAILGSPQFFLVLCRPAFYILIVMENPCS